MRRARLLSLAFPIMLFALWALAQAGIGSSAIAGESAQAPGAEAAAPRAVAPAERQAGSEPLDSGIGPGPDRSWLTGFGLWAAFWAAAVAAFLMIGGWLVFRWGGARPLPRHSPHDDIP